MGLRDYKPTKRAIKLDSTTIEVRGLSVPDVTRLVTFHLADIETAYVRFQRLKEQIYSRVASDEFFIGLCTDLPTLVSEVISIAADELTYEDRQADDEVLKLAGSLPMGVQIECLSAVMDLTFSEAGGIKNWFASLTAALRASLPESVLDRLAKQGDAILTPSSKPSIGASEET